MKIFQSLIVIILLTSCSQTPPPKSYPTLDYVTVGKLMDSIKPPYVIDARKGDKHVVFVGCDHNRDPGHPQFDTITKYFNALKPQITFNEGGQIADTMRFKKLNDGIVKYGETGALKYLSDSARIRMWDGDMADSAEFKVTLKKYNKEDLLLYYVMERLVIPYLSGAYSKQPFEELYHKAIKKWFVQQGFPLTGDEQSYAYFKQLFRSKLGHEFKLELNADIEAFDYINPKCKYCAVGRTSKMVRDSNLISKIDKALNRYDRVMVTFGHGHALALEPAVKAMVAAH